MESEDDLTPLQSEEKMEQATCSSHEVQVEAFFEDTNNVSLCPTAHLRDNVKICDFKEDEYYQDESESPSQHKSEIECADEELHEELELMESVGLPTSFGKKSQNKNNKQHLYEVEIDDDQNNQCETNTYFDYWTGQHYIIEEAGLNYDEINENFQEYWNRNSETLIWNSWVQKYEDYINPEYLKDAFHFGSLKAKLGNTTERKNINNKLQTVNFDDSNNQEKEINNCLASQSSEIAEDDMKSDFLTLTNKDDRMNSRMILTRMISGSMKTENVTGCNPELVEDSNLLSEIDETEDSDDILKTTSDKDYNLFSLRVKLEEPVKTIPTTNEAWDDLWVQHRQEQYEVHYKHFVDQYRHTYQIISNRISSHEESEESAGSSECDKRKCIFCGSKVDETELIDELSLSVTKLSIHDSRTTSNLKIFSNIENLLDSDIFGDDYSDIVTEESLRKEVCDIEAQIEEPIKVKREHTSDSDEEEPPAHCIKNFGFIVKPDTSLKIKNIRKQRKTKQQSERRCPLEMIKGSLQKDSKENEACNESDTKEEEKCSESAMKEEEGDASEGVVNENKEVAFITKELWCSVTPEEIASHIAERCACDIIVDAFCGAGANAIQFAFSCKHVIAIDIDPKKIELAKKNAKVCGVEKRITFIIGDFFSIAPKLKADVVFLSPSWGGPDYLQEEEYDISKIEPDIFKTFEVAKQITNDIALFVPKNTAINQLAQLAGEGNLLEIEPNVLNKKVETMTAYYGGLVAIKSET